jgi:hypothetical protein
MKKAKIMLLAVAIVGIAGTAMAFKAHKFGNFQLVGCTSPVNGTCSKTPVTITGFVTSAGEQTIDGTLTSSTKTCTSDHDCGVVVYTTLIQ